MHDAILNDEEYMTSYFNVLACAGLGKHAVRSIWYQVGANESLARIAVMAVRFEQNRRADNGNVTSGTIGIRGKQV